MSRTPRVPNGNEETTTSGPIDPDQGDVEPSAMATLMMGVLGPKPLVLRKVAEQRVEERLSRRADLMKGERALWYVGSRGNGVGSGVGIHGRL